MKPSKYQEAIYNWAKNGKGNVIVQAVAGSGKTTTIIKSAELIPKNSKSIFVAFNKAIADELQTKLPSHVKAQTLHSFGLSLFYNNTNNRPQVKYDKLDVIITNILILNDIDEHDRMHVIYKSMLKKVVPVLKAFSVDYNNLGAINDVLLRRGIEYEIDDMFLQLIKNVMDKCKKSIETIDFDDMIWIPVVNDFKVDNKYDFVFADEIQDLNFSQLELIKKMCGPHTRIIGVGDKFQSIYAFRGADSESMDNFKQYFKATELPLSICYRCPKSHIALAKEIVPQIETFEEAKEGIAEEITFDKTIEIANDADLILCRTNAPLVRVAFTLIRNGKKAIIRGKNIGRNLLTLISKYKASNLEDLIMKIESFKQLQVEKIVLIEKGEMDHRKKGILITQIDSCDTIVAISEEVETIDSLKQRIETIFSDQKEGIICSSIHKAKGLEADRVFIVNIDSMPHPMAKTEEEFQQEMNIKYVALTRSKKELYFVEEE